MGELVKKELEYVMEGVRMIKSSLEKEGKDVPLIGFSAAPWTLFYYMLGGSSKKNNEIGVEWLKNEPEASQALLDKLADVVVEYTDAQIRAGADCIQLFEAMGMMITESLFTSYCLPTLSKIGSTLKARHPSVPLIVFARGASFANSALPSLAASTLLPLTEALTGRRL